MSEKTWAIVVGIERYGFDSDLNGPAHDACRFVKWLREQQDVPADQIKLFLSPLPENRNVADDLDVESQPATQQLIYDLFEKKLPGMDGDTLYLFWGGHGQIAQNGERVLHYADALAESLCNLDLDNLLLTLHTQRFQKFQRQMIFVDACANHISLSAPLPKQSFTPDNQVSGIKQFALYAASAGESAGNDQTRRTGDFSRVVLDWLETHAAQSPPNGDGLANHVKKHFDALFNAGKTHQTPMWIRRGDGTDLHGDLESAFLQARLTGEIIRQIRPLPITSEQWQMAYFQTSRYLDRSPGEVRSRDQMVYSLARVQPEKGKDLPEPVYEFVWRAATANGQEDLRLWVEGKIADGTQLKALEARVEKESAPQNFHLMVELKPHPMPHKRKKLPFAETLEWQLWDELQSRSLPAPEGESKVRQTNGKRENTQQHVSDLVGKRFAQSRGFHSKASLAVEFFFDLDHLLTEDVDCWDHQGSDLGAIHPVAVRWRGRQKHLDSWRTLSDKLRAEPSRQSCPTVRWLPDDKLKTVRHLAPHFVNDDDCHPLTGFRTPPMRGTPEFDLLEAALECGAPFAFWPRAPVADDKHFQITLAGKAEQNPLDRFPAGIRQLRNEALGDEQHPAAALTLLWDDSRRNPYASGGFKPME